MIVLVGSYDFKDSSWNIQLQEYSKHQKLVAMYSNVRDGYVVEQLGSYCTPKVDQQGDSSIYLHLVIRARTETNVLLLYKPSTHPVAEKSLLLVLFHS